MSDYLSKLIKSSVISSIGLAILGVLLFFESEATIVSISYIIGGILIAIGVLGVMRFINSLKKEKQDLELVYGIVTVILVIIVISNPKAIASIIPFAIGILIVISSSTKLQYSLELKKEKNDLWTTTMILSIITMICGILLIFNPFKGAELIMKIVGVIIFVYAILDIISTISIKRTVKKIHTAIEESVVTEAEIVEEEKEESIESPKQKKDKKKKNKKKDKEEEDK